MEPLTHSPVDISQLENYDLDLYLMRSPEFLEGDDDEESDFHEHEQEREAQVHDRGALPSIHDDEEWSMEEGDESRNGLPSLQAWRVGTEQQQQQQQEEEEEEEDDRWKSRSMNRERISSTRRDESMLPGPSSYSFSSSSWLPSSASFEKSRVDEEMDSTQDESREILSAAVMMTPLGYTPHRTGLDTPTMLYLREKFARTQTSSSRDDESSSRAEVDSKEKWRREELSDASRRRGYGLEIEDEFELEGKRSIVRSDARLASSVLSSSSSSSPSTSSSLNISSKLDSGHETRNESPLQERIVPDIDRRSDIHSSISEADTSSADSFLAIERSRLGESIHSIDFQNGEVYAESSRVHGTTRYNPEALRSSLFVEEKNATSIGRSKNPGLIPIWSDLDFDSSDQRSSDVFDPQHGGRRGNANVKLPPPSLLFQKSIESMPLLPMVFDPSRLQFPPLIQEDIHGDRTVSSASRIEIIRIRNPNLTTAVVVTLQMSTIAFQSTPSASVHRTNDSESSSSELKLSHSFPFSRKPLSVGESPHLRPETLSTDDIILDGDQQQSNRAFAIDSASLFLASSMISSSSSTVEGSGYDRIRSPQSLTSVSSNERTTSSFPSLGSHGQSSIDHAEVLIPADAEISVAITACIPAAAIGLHDSIGIIGSLRCTARAVNPGFLSISEQPSNKLDEVISECHLLVHVIPHPILIECEPLPDHMRVDIADPLSRISDCGAIYGYVTLSNILDEKTISGRLRIFNTGDERLYLRVSIEYHESAHPWNVLPSTLMQVAAQGSLVVTILVPRSAINTRAVLLVQHDPSYSTSLSFEPLDSDQFSIETQSSVPSIVRRVLLWARDLKPDTIDSPKQDFHFLHRSLASPPVSSILRDGIEFVDAADPSRLPYLREHDSDATFSNFSGLSWEIPSVVDFGSRQVLNHHSQTIRVLCLCAEEHGELIDTINSHGHPRRGDVISISFRLEVESENAARAFIIDSAADIVVGKHADIPLVFAPPSLGDFSCSIHLLSRGLHASIRVRGSGRPALFETSPPQNGRLFFPISPSTGRCDVGVQFVKVSCSPQARMPLLLQARLTNVIAFGPNKQPVQLREDLKPVFRLRPIDHIPKDLIPGAHFRGMESATMNSYVQHYQMKQWITEDGRLIFSVPAPLPDANSSTKPLSLLLESIGALICVEFRPPQPGQVRKQLSGVDDGLDSASEPVLSFSLSHVSQSLLHEAELQISPVHDFLVDNINWHEGLTHIKVLAASGTSRLQVPKDCRSLFFESVAGSVSQRSLPLRNSGVIPLEVSIEFDNSCFSTPTPILSIEPDQIRELQIEFLSHLPEKCSGHVCLKTASATYRLPLFAEAMDLPAIVCNRPVVNFGVIFESNSSPSKQAAQREEILEVKNNHERTSSIVDFAIVTFAKSSELANPSRIPLDDFWNGHSSPSCMGFTLLSPSTVQLWPKESVEIKIHFLSPFSPSEARAVRAVLLMRVDRATLHRIPLLAWCGCPDLQFVTKSDETNGSNSLMDNTNGHLEFRVRTGSTESSRTCFIKNFGPRAAIAMLRCEDPRISFEPSVVLIPPRDSVSRSRANSSELVLGQPGSREITVHAQRTPRCAISDFDDQSVEFHSTIDISFAPEFLRRRRRHTKILALQGKQRSGRSLNIQADLSSLIPPEDLEFDEFDDALANDPEMLRPLIEEEEEIIQLLQYPDDSLYDRIYDCEIFSTSISLLQVPISLKLECAPSIQKKTDDSSSCSIAEPKIALSSSLDSQPSDHQRSTSPLDSRHLPQDSRLHDKLRTSKLKKGSLHANPDVLIFSPRDESETLMISNTSSERVEYEIFFPPDHVWVDPSCCAVDPQKCVSHVVTAVRNPYHTANMWRGHLLIQEKNSELSFIVPVLVESPIRLDSASGTAVGDTFTRDIDMSSHIERVLNPRLTSGPLEGEPPDSSDHGKNVGSQVSLRGMGSPIVVESRALTLECDSMHHSSIGVLEVRNTSGMRFDVSLSAAAPVLRRSSDEKVTVVEDISALHLLTDESVVSGEVSRLSSDEESKTHEEDESLSLVFEPATFSAFVDPYQCVEIEFRFRSPLRFRSQDLFDSDVRYTQYWHVSSSALHQPISVLLEGVPSRVKGSILKSNSSRPSDAFPHHSSVSPADSCSLRVSSPKPALMDPKPRHSTAYVREKQIVFPLCSIGTRRSMKITICNPSSTTSVSVRCQLASRCEGDLGSPFRIRHSVVSINPKSFVLLPVFFQPTRDGRFADFVTLEHEHVLTGEQQMQVVRLCGESTSEDLHVGCSRLVFALGHPGKDSLLLTNASDHVLVYSVTVINDRSVAFSDGDIDRGTAGHISASPSGGQLQPGDDVSVAIIYDGKESKQDGNILSSIIIRSRREFSSGWDCVQSCDVALVQA